MTLGTRRKHIYSHHDSKAALKRAFLLSSKKNMKEIMLEFNV